MLILVSQMNWAIFFILFSQQNNVFSQDFFSVFLLRRKRGLLRTPPFYFGTFCFHGLKAFLLPSLCLMPGKHVCRIYCKTWWDVSVLKAFIKSAICIYKKYEAEWESFLEEKYKKKNVLFTFWSIKFHEFYCNRFFICNNLSKWFSYSWFICVL